MKTKVFLGFGILFLSLQLAFGRWGQLGDDLDGETPGDGSGVWAGYRYKEDDIDEIKNAVSLQVL